MSAHFENHHAQPLPTRSGFTLEERLAAGWFTVEEAVTLEGCSRSTFYCDLRAGLLTVEKHGRKTRIHGPVLAKYLVTPSPPTKPRKPKDAESPQNL